MRPRFKLRLASFNIYKHMADPLILEDFRDLFEIEGLDVVGLQEIDWPITSDVLPEGWDVFQADGAAARKDPVLWRRDREPVLCTSRKVSERVDAPGAVAPERHVSIVVWDTHIFINYHANAGVQGPAGHPKKELRRTRENRDALHRLVGIADELQARYAVPVFIVGDFNVDYEADRRIRSTWFPYRILTRAGFTCCWEGRRVESTRRKKPVSGRTIDQMWVRGTKHIKVKFQKTHTPNRWSPTNAVNSDHLPVIATAVFRVAYIRRLIDLFRRAFR